MKLSLLDETLMLVNKSSTPVDELADACGVGSRWLRKVINGEIANPGVLTIEKVNAFLTNNTDTSGEKSNIPSGRQ